MFLKAELISSMQFESNFNFKDMFLFSISNLTLPCTKSDFYLKKVEINIFHKKIVSTVSSDTHMMMFRYLRINISKHGKREFSSVCTQIL